MRPKPVLSHFEFMVNSNIPVPFGIDDMSGVKPGTARVSPKLFKFLDGMRRIFLSRNILNFIHITDQKDRKEPKQDLLDKITTECQIEIAPTTRMLHAHITLIVHHRSTIAIQPTDFLVYFKKRYDMSIYASTPRIVSDFGVRNYQYFDKGRLQKPALRIINSIVHSTGEQMENFNVVIPTTRIIPINQTD